MRVLIAADSFKDALPANAVCAAIAAGLRRRTAKLQVIELPLADGGEGTLAVLGQALHVNFVDIPASDPLARPIVAPIGIGNDLAIVESATVCGLGLLHATERHPSRTTSYGLGQLIAAAAQRAGRVLVGVGGTATNDGGFGMAAAFGWRFLNSAGDPLPLRGDALAALDRIEPPLHRRPLPPIDVLCDVDNPLLGPKGATHTFAPQKGASHESIAVLEEGMRRLARCAADHVDAGIDAATPGCGAAGGIGFGAMLFLGARLVPGTDTILDAVKFENALSNVDVVITGEGRLDAQTKQGKLIQGLAARCRRAQKKLIVLCGQLAMSAADYRAMGIDAAYCIDDSNLALEHKLRRTAENLEATAARIPLSDFNSA